MTDTAEGLLDLPTDVVPPASGDRQRSLAAKLAFPLAYVAIAIVLVALFLGVLKINHGTFIYTLDDPYIHLALSDQIRHGNYGLFPGTHAAPSSSILFPFLLAIGSGTPVHPYLPLAINVCALFFTVEVMRRLLRHLRLGEDDFAAIVQAGALVMAALCFNLIGVVFTGLEHSLHIAAVAATVYGLALFLDRDSVPPWLPLVLVLSPLLRYEGLALTGAVLLVLALTGRVRTALATLVVLVFLVGGFSVFLVRMGLAPLPSSVLLKSYIAAGGFNGKGEALAGAVKNIDTALGLPIGVLLMLAGMAAALRCALEVLDRRRGRISNGLLMSLALFCLIVGQTVAGRFGWLERYELYAVVGTAMMGLYLGRDAVRATLAPAHRGRLLWVAAATSSLLLVGARYTFTTSKVPEAANNVYEQQLQLHNFVSRYYRGPVAVNDLGLVSYRNPYFVLDLVGLGSEKARLLTANKADADAYESFVAEHGIHLIMVYDEWFPGRIPETWQKVATMSLSGALISAGDRDVQFYVTDAATATVVRSELAAFRETLPLPSALTIESSASPD